jgi:hypothetical protein
VWKIKGPSDFLDYFKVGQTYFEIIQRWLGVKKNRQVTLKVVKQAYK